jgi:hypothetical protein
VSSVASSGFLRVALDLLLSGVLQPSNSLFCPTRAASLFSLAFQFLPAAFHALCPNSRQGRQRKETDRTGSRWTRVSECLIEVIAAT